MATSKAPKHDFAPAWLKIPVQENQKWPSGKQGEQTSRSGRNDEHFGAYHPYPTDYPYHPLTRQRSFDNYYDERPYSSQKYRHNSADDNYYNATYNGYPGYYNGYGYDKYSTHYRSQPALFRRCDAKYTHPNARFAQVSSGYPGYYDPYPYDYYPSDSYYGGGNYGSGRSSSNKSGNNEGRFGGGRGESREKRNRDEKNGSKDSLDEDFPSLKGEVSDASPSSQPANTSSSPGVWDNPPTAKLRSYTQSGSSESSPVSPDLFGKENSGSSKPSSSIYKALVPNKSLLTRRPSRDALKLNVGASARDGPSNCSSKTSTPTHTPSPTASKVGKDAHAAIPNGGLSPVTAKDVPTPNLEILNRRQNTPVRNQSDKKVVSLKPLKRDSPKSALSNGTNENVSKETEEDTDGMVVNGVERLSVSQEDVDKLSSSLEAEERLLKEMGWNETDDEDYEITEAEMKEFQNLTKQMKQKNGLQRSLPKTWSPQHLPVYTAGTADLSDSMSTSSDESDDDD